MKYAFVPLFVLAGVFGYWIGSRAMGRACDAAFKDGQRVGIECVAKCIAETNVYLAPLVITNNSVTVSIKNALFITIPPKIDPAVSFSGIGTTVWDCRFVHTYDGVDQWAYNFGTRKKP